MVIHKGQPWGTVVPCPIELEVVSDDASLASLLATSFEWAAGTPTVRRQPIALAGGDLHRTLGAPAVPRPGTSCRRLPVDALRCELDGVVRVAVAHVIVRRPGSTGWWRGPILGLCNAQFHRRWDIAPRGHPNDGRADLVEVAASMPLGQRRLALRRLPSGTHLPHPDITTRRVAEFDRDLDAGLVVHLDHRPVRGVRRLRVELVPDAFELYV